MISVSLTHIPYWKVYNSWTKKAIHPYQVGNWKVEIQNELGDIIGQTSFAIKEK